MALSFFFRCCGVFLLSWAASQQHCFAQMGGKQHFTFLALPTNTQTAALGNVNLTASTQNVQMATANPALTATANHQQLSIQYFALNAGITQTNIAYQHKVKGNGMVLGALQHLNYGNFQGYDLNGLATNNFSVSEYAFTVGYSHQIAPFRVGLNAKFAGSQIDNYFAGGVLLDVGGTFIHPHRDFRVGLVFKNMGFGFSNYLPSESLIMPFDVQVGASYKAEKMPFRFSLTAQQLLPPADIVYQDTTLNKKFDNNGNLVRTEPSTFDRLSRRLVIGVEVIISKNFQLRAGYNFLQRRELSVEMRRAMVGFSFGAMLNIKGFEVSFSRTIRQVSGGTTGIALSFSPQQLVKKKKVVE